MYIITKEFKFEAAHHLKGLAAGHQCSRQHGHSYRVKVELQIPELNNQGFVRDYGELDGFAGFLKMKYDHQDLNEIVPFVNGVQPSAENIARVLFDTLRNNFPELTAVSVSETQKTWAEYRP